MAEIVLIQPYTGTWDEMSVRPPESLLAIAAVPYSKGYDIKIIDQRLSKNFERELDEVMDPETVIVGITAITGPQIKYALKVTKYVKNRYKVPVCWGGVHATLVPEQTAVHPLIDYVIVGDGDYVFCELFERLRDKKPLDDLRGLVYKKLDGNLHSSIGELEMKIGGMSNRGQTYSFIRKNGQADVIRDMDGLPPLPYELVDIGRYKVFALEGNRKSTTLSTSRGCPFRCKFCSDPVLNEGRWRGFSPERILEKTDELYYKHGVRAIYFQDDYFPGPKPRFIKLLEGLKKYKRDLVWGTLGIRADTLSQLTDQEWDLLYESGCFSLDIGIESGNERVIKMVNKAETLDEMRLTNQKLAKYDIKVKYTLIVGFPGETEAEMKDTVRFACELQDANPNAYTLFFMFLPIIGTPFYDQAVKDGFKGPERLEDWEHMEFDSWLRNYRSWSSPQLIRKLEAISFTSYFSNKNVEYKFSNSALLRTCFKLYHPIARWRFRHQKFGFFFEYDLKDTLLNAKFALRRFLQKQNALIDEARERMALSIFDTEQ
ncbi:MAG: B12-binding domain-containing radical SAM protein [Candidatus Omnitrophica bacterium]|nr:B12-binding domain-containing radical SAM protein [Candidatus Omnitrophota bacterium]